MHRFVRLKRGRRHVIKKPARFWIFFSTLRNPNDPFSLSPPFQANHVWKKFSFAIFTNGNTRDSPDPGSLPVFNQPGRLAVCTNTDENFNSNRNDGHRGLKFAPSINHLVFTIDFQIDHGRWGNFIFQDDLCLILASVTKVLNIQFQISDFANFLLMGFFDVSCCNFA